MNHLYTLINLNDTFSGYKPKIAMCINPNLTWGIIKEESNVPWSFVKIGANPNTKPPKTRAECNDNAYHWLIEIAMGKIICDEEIIKIASITLSRNENTTWDIVRSSSRIKWDYEVLSSNPNITWDIVQANQDKPWSYKLMSSNPNITWDIVKANPDKPWSYTRLSSNPNITWEIIKSNPDKDWKYQVAAANPNITWDIVKQNEKLIHENICFNVNLSYSTIWNELCDIMGVNLATMCYNSNMTWKEPYYTGICIKKAISVNLFDRYNSSLKIQKVFRKWSRNIYTISNTLMLESIGIIPNIPREIKFHILNYNFCYSTNLLHNIVRDTHLAAREVLESYPDIDFYCQLIQKAEVIYKEEVTKLHQYDKTKVINKLSRRLFDVVKERIKLAKNSMDDMKDIIDKKTTELVKDMNGDEVLVAVIHVQFACSSILEKVNRFDIVNHETKDRILSLINRIVEVTRQQKNE
jgi:hypothetical protein